MSIANKIKYLIKWKGYPSANNSWEPIRNLDCPRIIEQYEAKHTEADNTLKWLPRPTKILSAELIDEKVFMNWLVFRNCWQRNIGKRV